MRDDTVDGYSGEGDGMTLDHEGMKAWLPSEDHGCSCDDCDPSPDDGFGHWYCRSCDADMSPVPINPEYFGLDRHATPRVFSREYAPAPPPMRERLYRAWRALLGDFG